MAYPLVLSPGRLPLAAAARVGASPAASSPLSRVRLLASGRPARSATVGPLRAHARLVFKQRAPEDDGGGSAKEACPRAPAEKDETDSDEYAASLWPWGYYVPGEDELSREDFATVRERFSRESKEAAAAVKGMVAGVFSPLLDNFRDLGSLKTFYDTEDHHIGMPFGAIIGCVGCYQLWKTDPSTFLNAALGFAFYKLSIVSSQLRKQGFANDLITRLKFVLTVVIMLVNANTPYSPLDAIRLPVFMLYALTFAYEVTGIKKQFKYVLPLFIFVLRHPKARKEVFSTLPDVEVEIVSESGIVIM